MKRALTAFFLITVAILLSIWSSHIFKREMDGLLYSINEIINNVDTDSDEALHERTDFLIAKWKKSSVFLHSIVMHDGMDELEENITALPMMIEHSNRDEFKKKCIEAVNQIKNLMNTEKIKIENIL